MDFKLIYIHIYSVILFVFKCAPLLYKYTPSMRQMFFMLNRQRYILNYLNMCLNFVI